MYKADTTVAAISTPPGKGGVALIRMSGKDAIEIASRCFVLRSGKPLSELESRHAAYGDVIFEGEPIDDALITLFRAPHSYTGEDTVEIACHGGILLTQTVLASLFAAGATQAEAGEFTRRALLSGRLSLTEAEAIGNLLEAKSHAGLRLSVAAARTRLARELEGLRQSLLDLISSLYAKIDYPEEDLSDMTGEEILSSLSDMIARADTLLSTYRTGRAVAEGIPTVLCGAPNVGKSALYNALCGEDLAIVTEHAGTTRDVLSATVPLGKVMLRLFDTAGLREALDPVERIGVDRSRTKMDEAELLLAVFDSSRPLSDEERELLSYLRESDKCVLILQNKADIGEPRVREEFADFEHVLSISAKTGEGLDALTALVERLFTDERIRLGEDAVIASARQFAALSEARSALVRAQDAFRMGLYADIASSELELALAALAELDGRTVSDEIISEIFRRFCVGK